MAKRKKSKISCCEDAYFGYSDPINELMASHRPLVMKATELMHAIRDYQKGKIGLM
jgi:hypothetical protein